MSSEEEQNYPHHGAVAFGHYGKALYEVFKYIGVDVNAIGYNRLKEITSLVVPLGATVNMDAVSIVMSFMIPFFASACGINVSLSVMVVVLLANVLLSIGTPGVPGGAIASFAALSAMVGLPSGIMGVYISVNTLADMGATCVNVLGDLACCQVLKAKLYPDRE